MYRTHTNFGGTYISRMLQIQRFRNFNFEDPYPSHISWISLVFFAEWLIACAAGYFRVKCVKIAALRVLTSKRV